MGPSTNEKVVTWNRVANMLQKYFMSDNKSITQNMLDKRCFNDYDFEYLKAEVMKGKDTGITNTDLETLFSKTLTPIMAGYKHDPAIPKYWDDGTNFGFVPREKALELAHAEGGSVLFFCCERHGNFGVATPEGLCFFICSEKLGKTKDIAQLILGEKRIESMLCFKKKPFDECVKEPDHWWGNLVIYKKDKKDCFSCGKHKDMNVPEGYTLLE